MFVYLYIETGLKLVLGLSCCHFLSI